MLGGLQARTPEPPGTGEYTWNTWHSNYSGDLLGFIKKNPYLNPLLASLITPFNI